MTIYELMVIAAAAVAFMVINIIMWSVISHKEKKEEKKKAKAAAPAKKTVSDESPYINEPEVIHHEKPADFILEENIVLVHTDEAL